MASATTVRLVISSEVRLVDVVHTASEAMAGIAGFDEDDALNVGIAVREAVINAIIHGNKRDQTTKVDVSLQRPRRLHPRPRPGRGRRVRSRRRLPTRPPGTISCGRSGRGILVIRAFVDSVDFKFREGHGMEVTLEKKRAARESSTRPSVAAVDNGGIER